VRTPCCSAQSFPVHPGSRAGAERIVTRSSRRLLAAAARATSAVLSLLWSSTTAMRNSPGYSCWSNAEIVTPMAGASLRAGIITWMRGSFAGRGILFASPSNFRGCQKAPRPKNKYAQMAALQEAMKVTKCACPPAITSSRRHLPRRFYFDAAPADGASAHRFFHRAEQHHIH
jgi:hypothetical protein